MRAFALAALGLMSLHLAGGEPPAPVVLELFTSEGCSSCPAADELARRLEQEPGVLVLGFHVDYWDNLGWKDPFSSRAFTERQFAYARALGQSSAYTPELVVDGQAGFVGSSEADARQAIDRSRRRAKLPVHLEDREGQLLVHAEAPEGRPLVVTLVLTESGLATDVLRGENRGRRLHHASAVRQLSTATLPASGTQSFAVDPAWRARHLRAVALLQDPSTRAILGAQALVF